MTLDEYQDHVDSNDGYCTTCKDFTQVGGVEPDARDYECRECGNNTLMGAEEALLEGLLRFNV